MVTRDSVLDSDVEMEGVDVTEAEEDAIDCMVPGSYAYSARRMNEKRKTVVLVGNVGGGKSSLTEKVTKAKGLSSNADESFTRLSHAFITDDGALQIIDTPGANAMSGRLEHNVWIAHALSNPDGVHRIMLVVKADTRLDTTIGILGEYVERFQEFDELLAVCVTHMDTVNWDQKRFCAALNEQLGISHHHVIFSDKNKRGSKLKNEILGLCKGSATDIRIDGDNFLKYFKLSNSSFKVMRSVRREVDEFVRMKDSFMQQFHAGGFTESEKVDLIFEVQTFMTERIYDAQKRVTEANEFNFGYGDDDSENGANETANEAGHIANLTNQLKAVLLDVRHLSFGYQLNVGSLAVKKCPHCAEVWTKVSGCEGATTCGLVPEIMDGRHNTFAHFSFAFDGSDLVIKRETTRQWQKKATNAFTKRNRGCGNRITWSAMAPVSVGAEFQPAVDTVTVEDVKTLPERAAVAIHDLYSTVVSGLGSLPKWFMKRK